MRLRLGLNRRFRVFFMSLVETFGHVAKHAAVHMMWMVPMAVMMVPSPTLAGSLAGSFEMITTSMWNFAVDGGAVEMFNATVSGDAGFWGGYEWGVANMENHAVLHDAAAHGAMHGGDSIVSGVEAGGEHVGHGGVSHSFAEHAHGDVACSPDEMGPIYDQWLGAQDFDALSADITADPSVNSSWDMFSQLYCPV